VYSSVLTNELSKILLCTVDSSDILLSFTSLVIWQNSQMLFIGR